MAETLDWNDYGDYGAGAYQSPEGTTVTSAQPEAPEAAPEIDIADGENALTWAQNQYNDAKSRGGLQNPDDELAYNIIFGTDLTRSTTNIVDSIVGRFGNQSAREFVTAQEKLGKDVYIKEFDRQGNPILYVNDFGELNHYIYDNGAYRNAGPGWNDAPYMGKDGGNKFYKTKQGNFLSYNPNDNSQEKAINAWKSTDDYQQRVANQEILSRYSIGKDGLALGPAQDRDYFLNDEEVQEIFGIDAGKMRQEAQLLDKFGNQEISALDLVRSGLIDEKTFQENFSDRIYDEKQNVMRNLTSDEATKLYEEARLQAIADLRKDDPNYGKVAIPDEDLPKSVQDVMNIPLLGQVLRATSEFYTVEGQPTMSLFGGLHPLTLDENGDPQPGLDIGRAVNPITHLVNAWNITTGVFDVLGDYVVNPLIGAAFEKQWIDNADPEFIAKWNEHLYSTTPPADFGQSLEQIAQGAERWQYIARNVKEQMAKGGATGVETELLSAALFMALTWWTPGGAAKGITTGAKAVREATMSVGRAKSAIKATQGVITKYDGVIGGLKAQKDELAKHVTQLQKSKKARASGVLKQTQNELAKVDAQLTRLNQFSSNLYKGIERNEKIIADSIASLGRNGARDMFMQAHKDVFISGLKLNKATKALTKTPNKAKAIKNYNNAKLEAEMAIQRREYVNMANSNMLDLGELPNFSQFLTRRFPQGFKATKGEWKKAGASYLVMSKQLAGSAVSDIFQHKSPFVIDANGYVTNVINQGFKGSTHIYNVMENPTKFKFAGGNLVADHEEIKMIRQLYSDRLDMFKKAGVDLKEMELEADQMWAARRAIKEGGKGGRALGKKTQEFEREFPTVDVGIAAGTKYEANYRQVIRKTMEDAYSMVAEKQLAEYVKKYAVDLLPDAKNITQKGVAGLLAKLNDTKAISDKTFLAKVSTKLKDAVARNAPDDELKILIKEAIESAESVVDKGALVSFKLRGTEGLKFLADDAKLFSEAINANKAWGGVGGKMLNVAQSITSLTRFTITAFDLGAGWIHGFPLLWNHPKIWGESWGRMLKAMNSKEWMYGYVAANKSAINDAIIRGHMVFESAEYMEGAGLITKIPGVGAVARKFEQAFTGYLDTARIELWKSLSKPNMTDDYARAIGSHVDRLMGSAHYASLGADKNFMALQSVILFAPRYYRSCLGLYKNIATGDIRGYRALQSVARMQANMHLSYYAMCQAMGQEAYLNPADSRYLSFKVGNSYIGLGGFHRSLNRLLVDVGNDISKGNGSGLVETIAEFGRAKLSTLMRLPVDMLTGTNFLGESIFDEGVFNAAITMGKGQLPIFLQAMLDEAPGDKIGDRVTRMGFEFLGLRSAGFNEYRQLEDARNKLAKQRFNVDYNTLEKKDIKAAREIADDPSIIALQDKVNAQYYGKGAAWWDETRKQYMEYKPAYNDIQEKWKTETFMICEDLRKGIIDIQTFKERVYAQNGIRSTEIDALNAKYPEVANIRYSAKDIPDDASKEYAAYYAYLDQVIGNPKLSDPALDAAGYSQIKNELDATYIKEWGDKLYDYVQQARLAGRGQHPIYSNFQLDKDEIAKSGYWDINPMLPEGRTQRQQFRVDNPYIDALLFRWGYTSTVQTKDAETMAKNLLKDIGITKTVPEAVNTARMRNISQQAWDYVNKTKSQMNKVSRSVSLNRIADTGYQLNSRINSLEKQIENALSLDKKVELIDTLQGEITKMNDLNTLLSTQPAEPYLNYFKAQVQAWMADAQIKWGYVSGFK